MNNNNMNLHFDKTILQWDEGLQLGNGDLGCLIWNKSNCLRFSIDKGGIWDCSNPPDSQENFNYNDIINLVQSKKWKKINKKYDDCYFNTTPTKLPTGKVIIDLGIDENVVSDLDFLTAEASVNAGGVILKSFIHGAANYGMISINKKGVNVDIDNPKFGGAKKKFWKKAFKSTVQSIDNLHYPPCNFFEKNDGDVKIKYFVQPTNDSCYGIVVAIKETSISTEIAYTVGIGNADEWLQSSLKIVVEALNVGYEKAFVTHAVWWQNYWSKSSVTLPDKFIENKWYLGNYLLASCSRKGAFPMPLQGVWTADNNSLPPWKGDYHCDLNTQMSYTSYLKANHVDEGECFFDFLFDLSQSGRKFAKNFYNVDGLCLPSVMDIQGHALGGWCQYALSPTNQLWLCQLIVRHFKYTGDRSYLEQKAYPYCEEVGQFLLGILKEVDGVYKLPLSTSPEIHDNNPKSWLLPNSNYDLALMHSFFNDMIEMSEILNFNEVAETWKTHKSKLEKLAINDDNVLMLTKKESLNESHRHHSHAIGIFPLRLLKYADNDDKKIIDSTIKNLEKLGTKNYVGYSFGWLAEFYTIAKQGDNAAKMLTNFWKNFCTDNGFHVNGDFHKTGQCVMTYRLFTLEGNFIAVDCLQEMLLYSEDFAVEVFPSIPKDWNNVKFETFRGCGGLLISAEMVGGDISYVEIFATKDIEFTLINNVSGMACCKKNKANKNAILELQSDNAKNTTVIQLKANDKIIFKK